MDQKLSELAALAERIDRAASESDTPPSGEQLSNIEEKLAQFTHRMRELHSEMSLLDGVVGANEVDRKKCELKAYEEYGACIDDCMTSFPAPAVAPGAAPGGDGDLGRFKQCTASCGRELDGKLTACQ